ncbi:glutamate decarboxylase isozyme, partial [Shigella dysenteriae]
SKARIIHQIQLIRGITEFSIYHLIEANDALRFDFHIEQVTPEGVQA